MHAGYVYTFVRRDLTAVFNSAKDVGVGVGFYFQLYKAVVYEYGGSLDNFARKALERNGGDFFAAGYVAAGKRKLAAGF